MVKRAGQAPPLQLFYTYNFLHCGFVACYHTQEINTRRQIVFRRVKGVYVLPGVLVFVSNYGYLFACNIRQNQLYVLAC